MQHIQPADSSATSTFPIPSAFSPTAVNRHSFFNSPPDDYKRVSHEDTIRRLEILRSRSIEGRLSPHITTHTRSSLVRDSLHKQAVPPPIIFTPAPDECPLPQLIHVTI